MQQTIKVMVVDDEAIARRRLARFLKSQPDVEIVASCENGQEAIAAIPRTRPDVMFLDVQMPEIGGFDVLSRLGTEHPLRVVFVTAYSEHAVRAFEVGALDYLLKPFDLERFGQAFARVRAHLRLAPGDYNLRLATYLESVARRSEGLETLGRPGAPRPLQRMMIEDGGRTFLVKVGDIDWIEAADNYVRIHTGKVVHLLRQTLATLEASLDPDHFARIHRGAVVNLNRIREIQRGVGRERFVVLEDGTELRLSDRYREQLELITRPRGA